MDTIDDRVGPIETSPDGERRAQRRVQTDLFVHRFLDGHP